MISLHPRQKLISIGARHRAINVRAQGSFTHRLVGEDAPVLAIVKVERLAELAAAIAKLTAAMSDRDIMKAESEDLTLDQGEALEAAKIWRRTITARAKAAALIPLDVPDDLTHLAGDRSITGIAHDVERLADLADPPDPDAPAGSISPMLAGLALVDITPELVKAGRDLAAGHLRARTARFGEGEIMAKKAKRKVKLKRDWTPDELLLVGARFRANNVKAQGSRTVSLLAEDPDAAAIVKPERIEALKGSVAKLEKAITDRDVMAEEAKDKTIAQGDALEKAKIWRRVMTLRVKAALVAGVDVPEDLGRMKARGSDFKALARDLRRLAKLAVDHLSKLTDNDVTPDLLAAGEASAAILDSADLEQDMARLRALPRKVREMYIEKAKVYLQVKVANLLAQSVHAEDGEAGEWNLDLLYREGRREGAATADVK